MTDTEPSFDLESAALGAAVGAGTFVVGLLVAFLTTGRQRAAVTSGEAFSHELEYWGEGPLEFGAELSAPSNLEAASWFYHQAHFAGVEATATDSVADGVGEPAVSSSLAFVEAAPLVLCFLPPILLLGAGIVLARRTAPNSPRQAAVAGASIAPGYGAMAVLSAVLLTWESSTTTARVTTTMSAGPELPSAVAFTAVLFPVAFGALGGYVANRRTVVAPAGAPDGV